eukprot:4298741-Prymnesium_polylepis.1
MRPPVPKYGLGLPAYPGKMRFVRSPWRARTRDRTDNRLELKRDRSYRRSGRPGRGGRWCPLSVDAGRAFFWWGGRGFAAQLRAPSPN